MPNNIHKTAIISKKAEISSNVTIGPFCSIGPNVKIEKDILEEDIEMIEDLILVAVNQSLDNAQDLADEKMKSATGGMMGGLNIPGM